MIRLPVMQGKRVREQQSNGAKLLGDMWGVWGDTLVGQRAGKCDVYWGRHACTLDPEHEGSHQCFCRAQPKTFSVMWGRGLREEERAEEGIRIERLRVIEERLARMDEFDRYGKVRAKPLLRHENNPANSKRRCKYCLLVHKKGDKKHHEKPCEVCRSTEHAACMHVQQKVGNRGIQSK